MDDTISYEDICNLAKYIISCNSTMVFNNDYAEVYILLQETAYLAIPSYDKSKGAKVSTYIFTCMRNALYAYYRKQCKINNTAVVQEVEQQLNGVSTHVHSIQEQLEYKDQYNRVQRLLIDIKNRHKVGSVAYKVLDIWASSNYTASSSAIAKAIGCSQKVVANVISRTRAKLKDYIT